MNASWITGGVSEGIFPLPLDTIPMEAKSADTLPDEPGRWQFEPAPVRRP
jgi:hypothetical protein